MSLLERAGLAVLRRMDPETAHDLALRALSRGLGPSPGPLSGPRLHTRVGRLGLINPVGIAAGFDKNAVAIDALSRCGAGFAEYGAATPRPQPGNPRPRLFRLAEDGAAINRFGFNNDGAGAIAARLAAQPTGMIRGLNLGANKDSADRAGDYVEVLRLAGPHIDFATVNVSSPNTAGLRDLQDKAALADLLARVVAARGADDMALFVKIAPDLDDAALADIAEVTTQAGLDGIVATNTTVRRDGLRSAHRDEAGGLSGRPLMAPSTRVLARLSTLTDLPLIGVGGIASAEDAYAKIRAGASAVQLYTALSYGGLSLVADIVKGLDRLLARDGHASVAEAVGTDRAAWL
ncbi:quinone-dependent dihydroorotate dehydrogenase [Rhodobacteraceae bacterium CCMM004]|nr:quinone-dependent dihydroorotate dehydrogenase [Rhodobacteraceae bacterium CCMM004]